MKFKEECPVFVGYEVRPIGGGPMLASKYHLDPCVAYNVIHSWAGVFREFVLKNINEDIFKPLYSNTDSRPNYPVRILFAFCILACFLKESFKDLHAELLTDMKVRYALDLMDYNPRVEGYEDMDLSECALEEYTSEEYTLKYLAPFSLMAVQRFLRKCENYYILSGYTIDLIHIALEDLFRKMASVLEIDGKTVRIDSMMVASYTKKMSRKELLYVNNSMFAKFLDSLGCELPEGLRHYLSSGDHNLVMYYEAKKEKEEREEEEKKGKKGKDGNEETKETEETEEAKETEEAEEAEEAEDSLSRIIREAQELQQFGLECKRGNTRQYKILSRIMHEQLIDDGKGGLRLRKKGEGMNSSITQSLFDLDATYREKNNKPYRGYSANLVEALGGWGSILLSYDLEQNTYTDLQFYRDYLKNYVDLDRFNGIPENLDALPSLAKLEHLAHEAEEARLQLEAAQAETADDQTQCSLASAGEGQPATATGDAADASKGHTAPSTCDSTIDSAASTAADIAEGLSAPSACDSTINLAASATADIAEGLSAPFACDSTIDSAASATTDITEGRSAPSACDADNNHAVQVTSTGKSAPTTEKPTMSDLPKIPKEILAVLLKDVYPQTDTKSQFSLPETDKDYYSLIQGLLEVGGKLKQLTVADAAFFSVPVAFMALLKGILLIPTNLTGKGTPEFYADFVFSMDGEKLISCACGHAPSSCSYSEKNKSCTAKFEASQCENCPYFNECNPRKTKKGYTKIVAQIAKIRATLTKFRKSELFKTAARFRNGIETAPSVLRRRNNIDHMQARGKPRVSIFVGFRVAALDIVKFLKGLLRKSAGKRASLDDFSPERSHAGSGLAPPRHALVAS